VDVTLETRRLILRPPQRTDAPRLARLLNNLAVSGNLARVPYPYQETEAVRWVASWWPHADAAETGFTLDLPGEGMIGHCGYHRTDGLPVIGYWLGEPYWNRGLMTEAVAAVIGWYFGATDAMCIQSGVFSFNKASLAVQRKLGFTEIGTSTLHCLARGDNLSHIDTRLTRARWDEGHNEIS
jgi:RimJ/RimL family protein N-acetyltransferase